MWDTEQNTPVLLTKEEIILLCQLVKCRALQSQSLISAQLFKAFPKQNQEKVWKNAPIHFVLQRIHSLQCWAAWSNSYQDMHTINPRTSYKQNDIMLIDSLDMRSSILFSFSLLRIASIDPRHTEMRSRLVDCTKRHTQTHNACRAHYTSDKTSRFRQFSYWVSSNVNQTVHKPHRSVDVQLLKHRQRKFNQITDGSLQVFSSSQRFCFVEFKFKFECKWKFCVRVSF